MMVRTKYFTNTIQYGEKDQSQLFYHFIINMTPTQLFLNITKENNMKHTMEYIKINSTTLKRGTSQKKNVTKLWQMKESNQNALFI